MASKETAERVEQACKEVLKRVPQTHDILQDKGVSFTMFNQITIQEVAEEFNLDKQFLWDILGKEGLTPINVGRRPKPKKDWIEFNGSDFERRTLTGALEWHIDYLKSNDDIKADRKLLETIEKLLISLKKK